MGVSKDQIVMTSEITKQFIDENLSQVEQKLVASMQSLYDLMIERKDSPLQILDPARELQDSPVGSILTYMGNSAPPHYLACDGSIYNISDYPALANHIKNEFKSYNKFGGNGTTTFAVPDLRGEFLRGGYCIKKYWKWCWYRRTSRPNSYTRSYCLG